MIICPILHASYKTCKKKLGPTHSPVKKRGYSRHYVCAYSQENIMYVSSKVAICNANAIAQVCIQVVCMQICK